MSVVRRLLVAAYLVEAGLLLVVAPWTVSWQQNYFGMVVPALGQIMGNEFVRGGISGIGLVTIFGGLRDLRAALSARRSRQPQASAPSRGLP